MAQKKEVPMKDLKPKKDAKGGVARQMDGNRGQANRGGGQQNSNRGNANSSTRNLL